jgi:hypothetical protein
MFKYFYLSTVDRKKHQHHYKLPAGDAVPDGEELTDLRPAGIVTLMDQLPEETLAELRAAFPEAKRYLKRKNAPTKRS